MFLWNILANGLDPLVGLLLLTIVIVLLILNDDDDLPGPRRLFVPAPMPAGAR